MMGKMIVSMTSWTSLCMYVTLQVLASRASIQNINQEPPWSWFVGRGPVRRQKIHPAHISRSGRSEVAGGGKGGKRRPKIMAPEIGGETFFFLSFFFFPCKEFGAGKYRYGTSASHEAKRFGWASD